MDAAGRDVHSVVGRPLVKEHLWIPLAGLLLLVGAVSAAPTSEPVVTPRLAARLVGASVVVEGRVSRVRPFDHDRVRVIEFAVDRVLKGQERLGTPMGTLEIVEMRDRPAASPLLETGAHAVVFLRRMKRGSYLDSTLGAGRRWQAVDGRTGVVSHRDRAVVTEVGTMVDRLAERSRAPAATADERAADVRGWTFDAVSGQHEDLVEDGAAGLVDLPNLAGSLTADERTRLEKALRRDDISPRIRAELVSAVARANLRSLAPTLGALRAGDAVVLDALWRAREALGETPRSATVAARLRDDDPAVRMVAVRTYARMYPAEAVPMLGRHLDDEDSTEVRIAVLEALGPVGKDEATEILEQAFVSDDALIVRQAAGRVLFERGGEEAAASFGRLAFAAAPEGQRHAVALLMALDRPDDDPILARIRETHPDPKTRELAEHGIKDSHH